MSNHTLPDLPDALMHEDLVMERYGHLFADRELREARKARTIEWHDLRKGPHYTREQLSDYLRSKVKKKCGTNSPLDANRPPDSEAPAKHPASSNSAATGSDTKKIPNLSTVTGMTTQLEELAAELLGSES